MEGLKVRRQKMNRCEQTMNRILEGVSSAETEKHLAECRSCRDLAELYRRIAAGQPERCTVPPILDQAVLDHAAKRQRPAGKHAFLNFFLRHAAVPIAAAVMVCFGLTFALHTSDAPSAATASTQNQQYDFDLFETDLLLLSTQIEDTSVRLTNTAAYSSTYTQNGNMK